MNADFSGVFDHEAKSLFSTSSFPPPISAHLLPPLVSMDLPNILNTKGMALDPQANARSYSDTASDRGHSPHMSEHNSKYGSRASQPMHPMANMANSQHYSTPTHTQHGIPMLPHLYSTPNGMVGSNFARQNEPQLSLSDQGSDRPSENSNQVKAFACSNCGKGFARRSDLARHERIHTGVRPHVCDYPGCNKQFIQRSALTVHARVHTGEKPHMCEHCTKPFSDSSSLARHRRIHSGKRPYKCPYADCQKTFTRRTTLTRHQNHHTGTVEEAAAATAAALASRPAPIAQRLRDGTDVYSDSGTPRTTPTPTLARTSMSPSSEIPQMPLLPRQHSDYSYMASGGGLPPHLRNDLQQQQHSPRSGSTSPSLSSFNMTHQRPLVTSHPSMYGPPPILEPPTQQEHRNPGSANASPHLSVMGWQSPTHPVMGSPIHHTDPYMYPDPQYGQPPAHMYYNNGMSAMRRPQSTEPDQYESKPRLVSGEVWASHM